MGHSVNLINRIISGEALSNENPPGGHHTQEERNDTVERNVRHLEIMIARDFWTNEDMTAVNAAITAGNGYTAS